MFLQTIRRNGSGHSAPGAGRTVGVLVAGGYAPSTIRAEAGVPLRLVFRREESAPCSEQVVFPALGKSAMLPQGEPVVVELIPEDPGEYEFTCAMGMLHGRLIVDCSP